MGSVSMMITETQPRAIAGRIISLEQSLSFRLQQKESLLAELDEVNKKIDNRRKELSELAHGISNDRIVMMKREIKEENEQNKQKPA